MKLYENNKAESVTLGETAAGALYATELCYRSDNIIIWAAVCCGCEWNKVQKRDGCHSDIIISDYETE